MDFDKITKPEKHILIIISRPLDFDCIASGLILKKYLESKGKFITIRSPKKFTPDQRNFFGFLPYFAEIEDRDTRELFDKKRFDLLILVDGANLTQFYDTSQSESNPLNIKLYDKIIHIDHHAFPEKLGTLTLHNKNISSTAEIILTKIIPESFIDTEIATLGYAAILGDTGNFKWCFNSDTLKLASILLSKGAKYLEVIDKQFFSKSKTYIDMLALAAENTEYEKDLQTTFLSLPYERMQKFDIDTYRLGEIRRAYFEHCAYTVNNYHRGIILIEKGRRNVLIGARGSNAYNKVNFPQLFLKLGGNRRGHFHASQMTQEGDFNEIKNKLISELKKQLSSK